MGIVNMPPPTGAERRRAELVEAYRVRFGATPCPWRSQPIEDFERQVLTAVDSGSPDPELLTVEGLTASRRDRITVD
jgi:hypothetical protein